LTELTTPLKPLEAMAMGKVVIGSNVRGIRELVQDGETGFLVEAEDPKQIAECLSKILTDVTLLAAIGHRAREFVKRERDWGRITEKYLKIYQ
jgi:glycosyltransferase involved in cell wall biosynthesis